MKNKKYGVKKQIRQQRDLAKYKSLKNRVEEMELSIADLEECHSWLARDLKKLEDNYYNDFKSYMNHVHECTKEFVVGFVDGALDIRIDKLNELIAKQKELKQLKGENVCQH